MPIYEYIAENEGCEHCTPGFEVLQRLSDSVLQYCPICTRPIVRRISAPAISVGGSHHLRESHFAKHGFTQYKRVEKGKYEKTAGQGPDTIASD